MIFAPNGIVGLATTAYRALRNRLRGATEIGSGQMPPDPHTV